MKIRNVLIVGASKGIGRTIATYFAKKGKCRLVLIARSSDLLETLKQECIDDGADSCKYECVDLMKVDTHQLAVDLINKYGNFDIVIHALGGSLTNRDLLGDIEDYEYALKFNALQSINMNTAIIRNMIDNHIQGRIIHISSISAKNLRGNPLYACSKLYLNAYVTTAGRQFAKNGICINSVMPGAVSFEGSYWDNFVKEQNPRVDDFLNHHQAIGRFGSTTEIAALVYFLSTPEASFICGSNLEIDGGTM